MTFEEWWEDYIFLTNYELTTKDLKACYEAGWNACAYTRCDETYGEYLEHERSSI